MTPTLLLDLDDTLLGNTIEDFMPAYLSDLSRHLAPYIEPQAMVPALLAATQKMAENQDPACTLQEVFDSHFYSKIRRDPAELQPVIDAFYRDRFPSLKKFTRRIPAAIEMVQQAMKQGHRLAVATNPLFPLAAIEHRLDWAGLPPQDIPYAIVPSYETMHFAKPSPAMLAELLARMGWPEGPVVMVGDRLVDDIAPARQLGLASYYVGKEKASSDRDGRNPTGSGPIGGLVEWLDGQAVQTLQPDLSSPTAVLAVLLSTAAALDHFCRALDPFTWTLRPAQEEWSLNEIICHLRDVDTEVNLPRVEKVLNETNPFLPGMVTDPWAKERQYICQDGPRALTAFIQSRRRLVDLLASQDQDAWKRTARHAIFGPTPLNELVSITASHDRLHIQQVIKTLNSLQVE